MNLESDDLLAEITKCFSEKKNDFPRGGALDYPQIVAGWISSLEAFVLPYVTAGGIAVDSNGHLTMHDKEHVSRVRQVAADLIQKSQTIELLPFELTLLLIAIYLHDIGNILGRAGHERQIDRVIKAAGTQLPIDSIEYATAKQIAGVHGGRVHGSKDTISTLQEPIGISSKVVRPRLLAAILRIADELADDPARANKVQMAAGVLPKGAEVFHFIAAGLHSQMINSEAREISLLYSFYDPNLFKRKLGKNEKQVYLLTEIFDRSLKTFYEARYCSRFMRPYLEFESVKVDIMIFDEDHTQLQNIVYKINERGYGHEAATIYKMVPELNAYNGNGKLTPAYLSKLIKEAQETKSC